MTNEVKHNPIICLLNCPNDASLKQLAISTKSVFPQNHLLCSMKAAVDLATKGKTPIIKLPSNDISTINGNIVPFLVSNWISAQLKKPPPKNAAKKAAPKKPVKGNTSATTSVDETPHPPENESQPPIFIYLTEYPKTIDQMKQLCASSSPVICYIYVDYDPTSPPALPEPTHKGNQTTNATPQIDWKEQFSSEIPFISINLISQNQNPEEACTNLLKKVLAAYEAFQKYREVFLDYRFISIPKYPKDPLPIPQIIQEKAGKQPQTSSGKGQNQPASIAAQLIQGDSSKVGINGNLDIRLQLQKAFKVTLVKRLNSFLERQDSPSFSPNFQHYAEILPSYPLPASLALILSHKASKRVPELFTMRSLAYRTKMDFQMIESTLIIKSFEDLIGYSVGERRHIEKIPLEFVPNILTPLLSFYGSFKWVDFAGKILLAFFNSIPTDQPLSTVGESLKLPLAQGFGSWFTTQETESDVTEKSDQDAESNLLNESQNSETTDQNKDQNDKNHEDESNQPQNDSESQNLNKPVFNSIGINVGSNDMFLDFDSNLSTNSMSRYFCESGLRVETTQPEIVDDLLSSLFFNVQYGSNTGPRFSFNISQKRIETDNETKKEEEEEDDDENIETKVAIRGVLGIDTQCYLDFSSADQSMITLMMKKSTVVLDVINKKAIITKTSIDKSKKDDELKRIITFDGNVIRYLTNGSIIIYKPDGSIHTCLPNHEWHLIDSNGHAYVKKEGQWFKDSQHDETSDVAKTYFIRRKVTNWSHGLSFIRVKAKDEEEDINNNNVNNNNNNNNKEEEDSDDEIIEEEDDNWDLTISYPDGTKYTEKTGLFEHPDLPNIKVFDQCMTVETSEYTATFSSKTLDFSLELKNNNVSIDYKNESSHLLIQYGNFKKVMTMIDLYTGIVAHAGLNRTVYYINEEFQWQIGRQNCSKKEILQHFHNNDLIKTITPVEKFDQEGEILQIISNGHKPRLFIIERDLTDLAATLSVSELLAASDFQSIMESSSNRITTKDGKNVTLWFDTEPKSYREIRITPKITDEQRTEVFNGMEEQLEIERKRDEILDSVSDPKWAKIDAQQIKEEEEIQALLRKYNSNANTNE